MTPTPIGIGQGVVGAAPNAQPEDDGGAAPDGTGSDEAEVDAEADGDGDGDADGDGALGGGGNGAASAAPIWQCTYVPLATHFPAFPEESKHRAFS